MAGLTAANANPWYVLMTLYGEQVGEEVDDVLHGRNRAAWNAWSCQAMTAEAQAAAKSSRVNVAGLRAWAGVAGEVARLHEAVMLERNGAGFEYPGLPDVMHSLNLTELAVQHRLVMSRAVFSGVTWFNGAAFRKEIRFEHTLFRGLAAFNSATFNDLAQFSYTTFSGKSEFSQAKFCGVAQFGGAVFNGAAWFTYPKFTGEAGFTSATFGGEAWFSGAAFSGVSWFAGAVFGGVARFDRTDFQETTRFERAEFKGKVDFGDAVFCRVAGFNLATFNEDVSFAHATFSERVNFTEAKFEAVGQGQGVNFTDCQFDKPTNFREAVFHGCYPDFAGAVLQEKTTFTDKAENWPRGVQADAGQAKASCAVIRHNLGRQGLPEVEHLFFRREMGFATQMGGWWARLPYRLFGWFSDFGYSIARPAWWLLGLWVVGGLILHSLLQWQATFDGSTYNPVRAFALSFANMVPVLGLQRVWFEADFLTGLRGGLKFVGGVQTVFALLLLFFLGLGLRQRFRLR